jgi:hypothetical protein
MIRFFWWALPYDLCKNLFGAKLLCIQAGLTGSTVASLGAVLMKSHYEVDEEPIQRSGFS